MHFLKFSHGATTCGSAPKTPENKHHAKDHRPDHRRHHPALIATAACAANGYNVTATVVDRAGTVRAVQRADNAGPHTLEASRLKAYTSASAKNTTLAIMEGSQKNPAAANLGQIPGYLLLGGGVPLKVGNEVIGAVGVGGAPGGHLDEQCAMAAIAKVADQLK